MVSNIFFVTQIVVDLLRVLVSIMLFLVLGFN